MFDKILTRAENITVAVTFAVMTILAFVNVVSRYALHGSLSWSHEIVTALAVYLIMVGTSAATRLDLHPGFTLLRDTARGWRRVAVVVAIGSMTLAFFVLLGWLGTEQVLTQMGQGRTTPSLALPQWTLSLAIPIGAVLGSIRVIQHTIVSVRTSASAPADVVDAQTKEA